uniref:Uncharacterized protein n=1 Tax=Zea mays TaxID=4577 RepID=B6TWC5_MAIZE|nr:hypothetical protein [Zea mays]
MGPIYITLCIFLVLVLHGDTTLAETCRQFVKWDPFCFSAMCKVVDFRIVLSTIPNFR